MSRSSSTYKEGYNRALDMIASSGVRHDLPTETTLAKDWAVSRTTVRSILGSLQDAGIINWSGRSKTVLRRPTKVEYFPVDETESVADKLPSMFMEHIFAGELTPGTTLRETELAKTFRVSSTVVREFLIKFSRFGLIEKNPNRHWVLHGFTRDFAEELFAVRDMFERTAFKAFLDAGPAAHQDAVTLRTEHEAILETIKQDYVVFPRLDERFHRVWIDAYGNRFVQDFFELISLIFHYHYRWNKQDELERNHQAIIEHLDIILALEEGRLVGAEAAMAEHLKRAKQTLFASVKWDSGPNQKPSGRGFSEP